MGGGITAKDTGCSTRNSSLELLRIFCIVAIIGDHFVGQSGIAQFNSYFGSSFYVFCVSLSRVACSVFIIISAWFLVDCPFKMKRICHTWLTVVMYTVPLTLLCKFIWHTADPLSDGGLFQAFFPIQESPLWFAGYYMVLILFSPVLNRILHTCSKKVLEVILMPFLILMVAWSTVTARLGFFSHDIWVFIFLYLLTGYLKQYPIRFFEKRKNCFLLFGIIEFSICLFKVLSVTTLRDTFAGHLLATYMEIYRARLQTLPNLAMAYALFFGFRHLKTKYCPTINRMAGTTLGIYCFHQTPCFYMFLWENIMMADRFAGSSVQYLYTVSAILGVAFVGMLFELIRNKISDYLIESRIWYQKFCSYIDKMAKEVW